MTRTAAPRRGPGSDLDREADRLFARYATDLKPLIDRGEARTSDVDGWFYWREANTEFVARFEAMKRGPLDDARFFHNARDDLWIDFGMPMWGASMMLHRDAILHVREALIATNSRPAFGRLDGERFEDEDLEIDVSSPDWVGADVASRYSFYAGLDGRGGASRLVVPRSEEPVAGVDVSFKPVRVFTADAVPQPRVIAVRVTVGLELGLPLPTPELLDSQYDRVVREDRKWHRLLPGFEADNKRPTPIVAARTWLVLLLRRAGFGVEEALTRVIEAGNGLGIPPAQPSQFRRERGDLFRRVPQARPLFRR